MMKAWSLFLLISLLLGSVEGVAFKRGSGFYLYEGKEDATAVIEFKPGRDFKDSTAPKIVIFYSPFCGHCINYAPQYMQLAKDVIAKYPEVEFWAVSCKSHRDECAKHTIRGYPTIHSYKAGSETSIDLGSNTNEAKIVKALQLDKPVPEVDRKLVSEEEDKEDETEATDDDKEATDEDKGASDEEKVTAADKDKEATDEDKEATDEDKDAMNENKEATDKDKEATTDKDEDTRVEESEASVEDNDADKKNDEVESREAKENEQDDESKEEADENEKPADSDKIGGQKNADESKEQDAADKPEDQTDADESEKQDAVDASKKQDNADGSKEQADADESKEQDANDESKEQDDADKSEEQAGADESEEQTDADESEERAELVDSEEQEVLVASDEQEGSYEDEPKTEVSEDAEDVDADEDEDTGADEDDDETGTDEDEDSDADKDEEEAEGRRKRRKQNDSPASEDIEGSKDDAPSDAHSINDAVEAYRAQNEVSGGVKPDAGAQKGKLVNRDMDQWRQIIAERRKSLEKRKTFLRKTTTKTAEPGATKVMKANTPGTTEYGNRVQSLLKKINSLRKKRGVPPLKTPAEITKKAKTALKKEVQKPGLAEKVPLIKRLVKMTPEEENILDSSLSFMAGLKYGLFMTDDALTAKQRAALKGWLDLLSVSLPPEWGLHALIDELNDNIDTVAQGQQHLLSILRKHPLPRSLYSASCRKPGSPQGFQCGLWKLFHTVTVGIAEHRGGLNLLQSGVVAADTRTFSPADAAATIREYIAHFFGCTDCRNNFLAKYDQCSFRRCDRLTSDAVTATPDDWKQLPLWLWEVHNDVSVRVAHEKIESQIKSSNNLSRMKVARLTRTDEIKHLFPSLEACFQCFEEDGSWDEDSVFEYLEARYWSGPDAMADKLLHYKDSDAKGSGSGLIWFFVIMLLAGIYVMQGRKGGLQRSMNAALVTGRKIGGKKRSV